MKQRQSDGCDVVVIAMYGTFPLEFQVKVREFVARRRVVDLGAGDQERAIILMALGAASVLAIDKEPSRYDLPMRGIEPLRSLFSDAQAKVRDCDIKVGHLAWPSNHQSPGLIRILENLRTVIYVGSNTNMNACGTHELFAHFNAREVLAYIPMVRNTLIIYGTRLSGPRALVHWEEHPSLFGETAVLFSDTTELFPSTRKLPDSTE
jgi:hypothetical protein